MAITVKHSKVSAIPDGTDTTVVRPSDWNADHALTGVIDVANGGTGAAILTGYVKGNGTSAMTASATVPSGDITGLGTMSTQNANAVVITGGTINGTTIGATTPSTGAFSYASTNSTTSTTPALGYNASNASFVNGATIAGSYLQNVMQNKSGTAGASTNFAVSNDLGTDSTYYGEFGMNSSVYSSGTPADFFSINNGVYFSGHDGDITLGSGNGYKTYLAWGTTGQSAHVINATGAIGLNTNITGTTNFGTSGQVLTSAGSGATPTWTTPSGGGSGTVTSITAGSGLSGGTITTSGTVALNINGLSSTTVAQNDTVPVYHTSTTSNANCLASDIAGLGVGSIGYRTNYYYYPYLFSCNGSSSVLTTNAIYYLPFFVRQKTTFTRIGIQVVTASGTNARLGIYNSANGVPTSLALDCGTISTASTGDKEATISQTLNTGFYFLAIVADNVPTVYYGSVSAQASSYALGQDTRTTFAYGYQSANGSITLPSTATSFSPITSIPAVSLRVV